MASRSLEDLHPDLRKPAAAAVVECSSVLADLGVKVIVTCTYRSNLEQGEIYAQGRTKPGRVVTWAKPGQSKHNRTDARGMPAAEAIDIVPLRHGRPVWGTGGDGIDEDPTDDATDDLELWQRVAAIFKSHGFAWAGDWPKGKREFPHFEMEVIR